MKNISPHVEIYRFPITAISSITNRGTGLYLTGIFIGSGLTGLIDPDLLSNYSKIDGTSKLILDYSILFSGSFHIFGGIRHFIWDKYPNLLINTAVTKSSFTLFGISILSSIIVDSAIKRVK